jgi:hypothetical protein
MSNMYHSLYINPLSQVYALLSPVHKLLTETKHLSD